MRQDIQSLEDIKLLVDTFYHKVQKDDLIGPIFNEKIQDRWPEHLNKMYHFWETVLLEVHSYSGSPFPPHANLPVESEHFDRWMSLFSATVDTLFEGDKAEEVKWRAGQMGKMFLYKIEYFREKNQKPIT